MTPTKMTMIAKILTSLQVNSAKTKPFEGQSKILSKLYFSFAEKKPTKETVDIGDENDSEYNDDDEEDDDDDEISLPSIDQKPEIMEELDSINSRIEDRKWPPIKIHQACNIYLLQFFFVFFSLHCIRTHKQKRRLWP